MIEIKTASEISRMRDAGRVCAACMEKILAAVRVGVTTGELDRIAYEFTHKHGGVPSFLNYAGFPASICASLNEAVVHGIPSGRRLEDGDVLSIDMGVRLHGYHSDMARTIGVGSITSEKKRLIAVTRKSFFAGMEKAVAGTHLNDLSAAVQKVVEEAGFSVVRDLVGHGIGRELHESPDIPNFSVKRKGPVLRNGMVLAIEPMVAAGDYPVETLDDGWTVVTADGSCAAHYENTVAVTANGPEILTRI